MKLAVGNGYNLEAGDAQGTNLKLVVGRGCNFEVGNWRDDNFEVGWVHDFEVVGGRHVEVGRGCNLEVEDYLRRATLKLGVRSTLQRFS